MRLFVPDPALKTWYDGAIRSVITIRNLTANAVYPFQTVPLAPLPPRPTDPLQAGFYDGVLVRLANAVQRFNDEANRLNGQIQGSGQYQPIADPYAVDPASGQPLYPEMWGTAPVAP